MGTKTIDRQDLLPMNPRLDDLLKAIEAAKAVAEVERSHVRFTWSEKPSVEVTVAADSNPELILNTIFVTNHTYQNAERPRITKVGPYPTKLVFDPSKAKLYKPQPRVADEAHLSERRPVLAYQVEEAGWATGRCKRDGKRLEPMRDWYVWPGDWYLQDTVTNEIDVLIDEQFRMGRIV